MNDKKKEHPLWDVWMPSQGERGDSVPVVAIDAESAALAWVEKHDGPDELGLDDTGSMRTKTIAVCVACVGNPTAEVFEMWGEKSITYSARKVGS